MNTTGNHLRPIEQYFERLLTLKENQNLTNINVTISKKLLDFFNLTLVKSYKYNDHFFHFKVYNS